MYPENPEGTQVIVGSMNMGYISDTARYRTHNLFRPKRAPIPLGHSDIQWRIQGDRAMPLWPEKTWPYDRDRETVQHGIFPLWNPIVSKHNGMWILDDRIGCEILYMPLLISYHNVLSLFHIYISTVFN